MEFYIIPPTNNLKLMHCGQRYFCLAQQYLKSESYREFFYSLPPDAWVTLDNGAGDHDIVTEDQLFDVMKELIPNEVIPPDILFKDRITRQNAMNFHDRMKREGLVDRVEIFFCPQGKDQDEWLMSYRWALKQDWIKTIGWSKIALPKAFLNLTADQGIMEARHIAFNYLKAHGLIQKPIHLLGSGSPQEFGYYQQFKEGRDFIRSSDSCNSVWSAMNGINWYLNKEAVRIPTPKDYFDRKVLQGMEENIHDNITFLKESVL